MPTTGADRRHRGLAATLRRTELGAERASAALSQARRRPRPQNVSRNPKAV